MGEPTTITLHAIEVVDFRRCGIILVGGTRATEIVTGMIALVGSSQSGVRENSSRPTGPLPSQFFFETVPIPVRFVSVQAHLDGATADLVLVHHT